MKENDQQQQTIMEENGEREQRVQETTMEENGEREQEEQPMAMEENGQEQQPTYSVFIPDFNKDLSLASSSLDRYNDSIRDCLEKDLDLIQQNVNLQDQSEQNNFFKNTKWAPDGTCLLTNSADDVVRLFSLPSNVYEESSETVTMIPNFGIREGESVYDFDWYPLMNSQDPDSCCFITSVRDHPVQLWDMKTASVMASYSVIDHCERYIGPNVITFHPDGSKIYCGYENMIEIFDVHRPGNESDKIPTIPTRKSRKGQKGIISCLDFSLDGLYAAGSYSQSIAIYDQVNHELCLKLVGFTGGTTQVKFSKDGNYLFSASRHANSILCWDIRDSANILYELPRPGKTNQRIHFDFDPSGRHIITGDQFGNLIAYDISLPNEYKLIKSVKAHDDLISSVSFNPVYPIMATCSGQRKFNFEDEEVIDNSLRTWRVPGEYEWFNYVA
ncbi:hypothetical protein G6F29_010857 [Rhizopus arrhizus]|uniref:Telomerase Cajal body protein 1 n=1 Tax=Rhizopus oryzae TaxID=64495 RepID=A0A9P7BN46_RHIOR|nr:hypothetical protein G6F24_007833 [Rhizopus arrhizus]KAG1413169.1 hypothetical protein G6F58_007639 [Rhizopus delemar]KAG0786469.1 hypothetical protein G6F21_008569 [Rhizopus arrhizus]KAG0807304.1 hypothetical protein G6F20_010469 [Rhizopus arrhizus]KAG0834927.1 hypothetical protein G6F19_004956 [Rhizopus arrhizus]